MQIGSIYKTEKNTVYILKAENSNQDEGNQGGPWIPGRLHSFTYLISRRCPALCPLPKNLLMRKWRSKPRPKYTHKQKLSLKNSAQINEMRNSIYLKNPTSILKTSHKIKAYIYRCKFCYIQGLKIFQRKKKEYFDRKLATGWNRGLL